MTDMKSVDDRARSKDKEQQMGKAGEIEETVPAVEESPAMPPELASFHARCRMLFVRQPVIAETTTRRDANHVAAQVFAKLWRKVVSRRLAGREKPDSADGRWDTLQEVLRVNDTEPGWTPDRIAAKHQELTERLKREGLPLPRPASQAMPSAREVPVSAGTLAEEQSRTRAASGRGQLAWAMAVLGGFASAAWLVLLTAQASLESAVMWVLTIVASVTLLVFVTPPAIWLLPVLLLHPYMRGRHRWQRLEKQLEPVSLLMPPLLSWWLLPRSATRSAHAHRSAASSAAPRVPTESGKE
ncbi:hypothetical protein ACFYW6_34080 [Streptomyces sp. NPDC002659]|uniref:hypothetical protein n=1 Tax=Streptomyces sp. NPDC002659 TaxID=3364656 RepID=UPI00369B280F